MTTPLRARFLEGMSHAACTVNVVTTDGPAGRAGVTVSAMSSVSADTPAPTLLVCVHHLSPAAERIIANGVFCVNVLRDDQSYISDAFAGRFKDRLADKFACADWTREITGSPRVRDPLAAFDCRVTGHQRVGTHHVFFGEVAHVFHAGGSPLIYANRAYGTPTRIEPVAAFADAAPGRRLRVGCFHTFGPYVLPGLVARLSGARGVELTLVEGDQRRLVESLRAGETDLALVYDFDLPPDIQAEALAELAPYVLLAEGHPLGAARALRLAELAPEPLVLLDAPPSADYFLSLFTDAGLAPRVAWRIRSFEMVRGLVGHGLGYALLATKPAAAVTYDGRALVTRPLAGPARPSRVVLARRRDLADSAAARDFAAQARALFGAATPAAA